MITINKKYTPIATSDTRYSIVTGGRGSGKSFSINTLLCLMLLEPKQRILFLRQTLTSAYLSIIPEFLEKIELLNLTSDFDITKTEIIHKPTGNAILFRGIQTGSKNNTANLKSLQGINILVIDEAEEVTDETVFDRINLSIRQKGVNNKIILILNPSSKESWIYKRFFEQANVNPGFNGVKGNVTYIHTSYKDNLSNLDQSFIDEADMMQDLNPSKYQHQILGGWLDKAEGVVYTKWVVGDFIEVSVPVFGQDYGFYLDPSVLVKTSIDNNNKIIYIQECFYKQGLSTTQIAELNIHYAGKHLIYGDGSEARLIEEVKQKGVNIKPAEKGPGSITAGIAVLQDYTMVIDGINIVKELNNYVWHDRKSDTPIDDYNHALDSIRYAVYSQIVNKPLTRPKYSF